MSSEVDDSKDAESLLTSIQNKISNAFDVFVMDGMEENKSVDVREVGCIVRSLGCSPTEGELHDILAEIVEGDDAPSEFVKYDRFLPVMTQIMLERRYYRPVTEKQLKRAFEVLDADNKGFLTGEELTNFMTDQGEPFSPDELQEMLTAAADENNKVHYRNFISMMVPEDAY